MRKECISMILAGGRGERLGVLTENIAKPAVPFGGKYKIIDFTLSNCANSGIDTIGVLTQYEPFSLNSYIGKGTTWDLYRKRGGIEVLPPYMRRNGGQWYKGTANAVYQNIQFIEHYHPQYVMILSGDHIYKMDYSQMLKFHKDKNSEVTISAITVPLKESGRFGIINTDEDNRVSGFEEKPRNPKSNIGSMGVYIFNWSVLRQYLAADECSEASNHDFGKDLIPAMLQSGVKMYTYPFTGYWKDVGTVESLWEANMDLLTEVPKLNLYDKSWPIYSFHPTRPPEYIGDTARVKRAILADGCIVHGEVVSSILSPEVYVGKGSTVSNSVIMPNVVIQDNVVIDRAIVCPGTVLHSGTIIRGGINIALIGEEELQIAIR